MLWRTFLHSRIGAGGKLERLLVFQRWTFPCTFSACVPQFFSVCPAKQVSTVQNMNRFYNIFLNSASIQKTSFGFLLTKTHYTSNHSGDANDLHKKIFFWGKKLSRLKNSCKAFSHSIT